MMKYIDDKLKTNMNVPLTYIARLKIRSNDNKCIVVVVVVVTCLLVDVEV